MKTKHGTQIHGVCKANSQAKTRSVLAGFAVLLIAAIFTFAGCDNGSTSDNGGDDGIAKSITITGLNGQSGQVTVSLIPNFGGSGPVATGQGTISGSSVTVSLKKQDNTDWTGTGSYYMEMQIVGTGNYYYTNGQTFAELGIANDTDIANLPKISITAATTSIGLDKFTATGGN